MNVRLPARLCVYGAASVVIYAWVYRGGAPAALGPLRNLVATMLATLPLAFAAREAEAERAPDVFHLLLLLVLTASMRLAIPFELLVGSDDATRYLWDGRVQAFGINPYLHPPSAPALASLRDHAVFVRIFRPDMRTVYPPLAQLWFLLAYALGGLSLYGLKLIYLAHDLASAALSWRLLQRAGAPPWRALLLAWSPLCVVQGFAGAHLDTLLVPWLLALLLWIETRPFAAGCALGLSAMVRPITALAAPALVLRRPLRETSRAIAGFLIVCALLVAPYAWGAGARMVESLQAYGQHWQFNGSLYQLLHPYLHDWAPFRRWLYGAIAALSLLIGLLPGGRASRMALALGAYLALAPTVYPWYLLAPLALIVAGGGPLPLALPALGTLSDLVFVGGKVGGPWRVPTGALLLEYAGLYGLVGWQLWRTLRRDQRAG